PALGSPAFGSVVFCVLVGSSFLPPHAMAPIEPRVPTSTSAKSLFERVFMVRISSPRFEGMHSSMTARLSQVVNRLLLLSVTCNQPLGRRAFIWSLDQRRTRRHKNNYQTGARSTPRDACRWRAGSSAVGPDLPRRRARYVPSIFFKWAGRCDVSPSM